MKLGPSVIGIIIAGALGYFLEPSIRPALLPVSTNRADEETEKVVKAPPEVAPVAVPEAPPVAAAPAWVSELKPEQLPALVTLKSEASLPVAGASAPMVVPSGVQVKPLRVEGDSLVINFGGIAEGSVPTMATDLVELLGNEPPPEAVVAAVDPAPPVMEDPVEPPAPAPEAVTELTPEEIVSVMQASVKDGEIKEFTFDQVIEWNASDEKESGGETYQSGLASYKAETIFGVKNIQAQALIKEGKVEKWIWPKSGMEIK
ncbi:hypothetical protein [Haloferula sp.]|uniref:hypothetical protein n=1 Tax=Haloferula sp. TaxID=2497595 RepID=UPI003C7717FB